MSALSPENQNLIAGFLTIGKDKLLSLFLDDQIVTALIERANQWQQSTVVNTQLAREVKELRAAASVQDINKGNEPCSDVTRRRARVSPFRDPDQVPDAAVGRGASTIAGGQTRQRSDAHVFSLA
jgi:hypothetical protein